MSAAAIAPLPASPSTPSRRSRADGRHIEHLHFSAAPMLCAACCFASGILLSRAGYEPPAIALLVILLLAFVTVLVAQHALRPQAATVCLVPLCMAWVVAGLFCMEVHPWPSPQKELLAAADNLSVFEGEIVRAGPLRSTERTMPFANRAAVEESQTLDVLVHSTAWPDMPSHHVKGGVRLTLYAPAGAKFSGFACGDQLSFQATIHAPDRYNDPGVWDSAAYLLEQGIGAIATAKAQSVFMLPRRGPPSLACKIKAAQMAASERIMQLAMPPAVNLPHSLLANFFRLTSEDTSMLAAMITGDRSWLQRRTRIGFERTGSFHLLVVSGLHLAIFAGIIFWLAQTLRLARFWASMLTILAALAYAVFTGFGQPVQRSFWMVTLYLLGRLLWRERSPLNAIGFAALCLLAAKPPSLFDAGFQMTLLSVVAIAGIAIPLAERTTSPYLRATRALSLIAIDPTLPPRVAQFRVSLRLLGAHLAPLCGKRVAFAAPAVVIRLCLRVAELLLVSLIVEAVMSMPMALYFHRVTVLALPVNFLIVPFLGLLLPSALLTFAALLVSSRIAMVPAAATAALLHSVTALIHIFASIRAGDLRLPGPSRMAIAAYLLLLVLAVCAVRFHRLAGPVCTAALTLMVVTVVVSRPMDRRSGMLEITAIDVGQGDSLLIVTPEGKTLLIDAGGSPFGPPPEMASFDVGEEVISAYLWSRGIRRLDAVALTHAHADHIGGMPAVLANFRPREVWVGANPHSEAYDAFLAEGRSYGATILRRAAGESFSFGSAQVQVLAPGGDYHPGPTPANNDSLVLRVGVGRTAALLEGDAESPSEARMLHGVSLRSNLLKVGHHGSRSSTTQPFLEAVDPSYAIISVGRRNLYGHPRMEILRELQARHIRTYRTDTLGATTFYLDGQRVEAKAVTR